MFTSIDRRKFLGLMAGFVGTVNSKARALPFDDATSSSTEDSSLDPIRHLLTQKSSEPLIRLIVSLQRAQEIAITPVNLDSGVTKNVLQAYSNLQLIKQNLVDLNAAGFSLHDPLCLVPISQLYTDQDQLRQDPILRRHMRDLIGQNRFTGLHFGGGRPDDKIIDSGFDIWGLFITITGDTTGRFTKSLASSLRALGQLYGELPVHYRTVFQEELLAAIQHPEVIPESRSYQIYREDSDFNLLRLAKHLERSRADIGYTTRTTETALAPVKRYSVIERLQRLSTSNFNHQFLRVALKCSDTEQPINTVVAGKLFYQETEIELSKTETEEIGCLRKSNPSLFIEQNDGWAHFVLPVGIEGEVLHEHLLINDAAVSPLAWIDLRALRYRRDVEQQLSYALRRLGRSL